MKKAFAALPLSLFAVFSLASCGGNAGYSDSYENYLASVDATKSSKNMTLSAKDEEKYFEDYFKGYYTYYQFDLDYLDENSELTEYYGFIYTDGITYTYNGKIMSNLSFETSTNISKDSAAVVLHSDIMKLISYNVISSSSFYKALTYEENGAYSFENYKDFEEGSITLKDGYISHLYLKDSDSTIDITFSDYGTTTAKTIDLPENK